MAERRLQVQELQQAAQSSVRPTARPVDTYVRPAAPQTQASELSQFVAAIAPAIQADADERRKERLVRERKIQEGIYKNQLNQATQSRIELLSQANMHYKANKEEYLALEDDEEGLAVDKVKARRKTYFDGYINEMKRTGVDEVIIQALENDLLTHDALWVANTYAADKFDRNKETIDNKLTTAAVGILDSGLDADSQVIDINEMFMNHVDANGGDFRTALDKMWELAVTRAGTNADNALVEWLKSPMSSPEGQPAQWEVGSRAKQRAQIEKAALVQANAGRTSMKKAAVADDLANRAADVYINGNVGSAMVGQDVFVTDEQGNQYAVKHQASDFVPVIEQLYQEDVARIMASDADTDTKEAMIVDANRRKYAFFHDNNLAPPEVRNAVSNGKRFLTQGDLTDPENLKRAEEMYSVLNAADEYADGMVGIALKGDDVTRFRHLQVLVNSGRDFSEALGMVQGVLLDDTKVTVSDDDSRQALDNNWLPWLSQDANAKNIRIMTDEANRLANALLQTDEDMTAEEAKKIALEQTSKDYKGIKNTDGSVSLVRVESNALKSAVNVEQIEQGLEDLKLDPDIQKFVNQQLSLSGANFELFGASYGYELSVGNTGNPNQLYIFAEPASAEKGAGDPNQRILLTTVNIWDFNKNRIDGIKDQVVKQYSDAKTSGLLPDENTSSTPSLNTGGAAGEGSLDAAVASTVGKVGQAVLTDDDTEREQILNTIIQNAEQSIAAEQLDDVVEAVESVADEDVVDDTDITADDVETISMPNLSAGSKVVITGDTSESIVQTLKSQEGFSSTQYPDADTVSVGHGFKVSDLEPDELALIKDVNNISEPEADAVLRLKAQKHEMWWTGEVENFTTLPEETQVAAVSMAYQLGRDNLPTEWPKFMDAMKRAGAAAEDSWERTEALLEAQFHMLYNEAKDGTIKATKWAGQTANRAMENAKALASGAWNWFTQKTGEAWDGAVSMVKDIDEARQQVGVALIPAHFRMFAQDITGVRADQIRTEDFFQEDELEAMRYLVIGQMAGGATSGAVEYKNYDKGVADVSWKGNVDPLSLGDAQGAVKKTLGQFTWKLNDKGEIIITDQYNFNDAKKYREMYPSQAERLAHLTALAGLVATDEMSAYGWLRRVGALYGSAEGEGAKFEINLGKP
jgi:GH24 family phage-related lysozyme (muramidase)